MNKKGVVLVILLVLFSLVGGGCKKTATKPVIDETIYEFGKKVVLDSKSTVTVQDIILVPEYKLQTTLENVQKFPYVYLKKDKSGPRIIRIERDGNTIDTLVDTVSSKSYGSAYIVEAGGDLNKTIARYVLDTKKDIIKPRDNKKQFAFLTILYKNETRKTILSKDLKITLVLADKSTIEVDPLLAETILSSSLPTEIKPTEIQTLRYIGVVPIDCKEIIINWEGKNIKWENKEIKPTK